MGIAKFQLIAWLSSNLSPLGTSLVTEFLQKYNGDNHFNLLGDELESL